MGKRGIHKIEDFGTVILKVYAGSRAYGTNITREMATQMVQKYGGEVEDYLSDVDIRGVFIPHREYLIGPKKVEIFEDPVDEDTVYYSLDKFLKLALENNPNILEQLFVDDSDVLFETNLGKELRELGPSFLSRNCYSRYVSYSTSQLKKMTPQNKGATRTEKRQRLIENVAVNTDGVKYDTKNAMHLIRLLRTGIEILRDGKLLVKRPDVKELLQIRNGKYSLEELKQLAQKLDDEITIAMENSTIQEIPDFEKINTWAMKAIDEVHGVDPSVGVFQGSSLRFLPLEYEMIDKTSLFLVGNPLIRRINHSQAFGSCIPYKDWFTGLREFSEFKFDETTIEHIHKFVDQVRACNPKHMDILFAPEDKFLLKHHMTDELFNVLRTLPTTKRAFHTARGFISGNLKKMEQWEKKKAVHNELRKKVHDAKKIPQESWDEKFALWDGKKLELATKFKEIFDKRYEKAIHIKNKEDLTNWRNELDILNKQYRESMELLRSEKNHLVNEHTKWSEYVSKKGQTPYYPPMEGMDNLSSSSIGKFGYDCVLASSLVHVARMFIELLLTGTIQNSRAYESEMYAVRHGKYKSFDEFKTFMEECLSELEATSKRSKLGNHNYEEVQDFLIDFINRFHKQL